MENFEIVIMEGKLPCPVTHSDQHAVRYYFTCSLHLILLAKRTRQEVSKTKIIASQGNKAYRYSLYLSLFPTTFHTIFNGLKGRTKARN